MANRLKWRSPSGVGRTPRPAAIRMAIVPPPGGAMGWAVGESFAFIGHLPDGWRRCELLDYDATEGDQDSCTGFDGQRQPELARDERTGSSARARGGTAMIRDRHMMALLVDPSGN